MVPEGRQPAYRRVSDVAPPGLGLEGKHVAGFVPPAAQVQPQLMEEFRQGGQEVPTPSPPESSRSGSRSNTFCGGGR